MSHAGFQIQIDDAAKHELARFFTFVDDLRDDIFTALLFKKEKSALTSFALQRADKIIDGYITGLYINSKQKIVVAEVSIEGKNLYATLVHARNNTPLIDIKKHTSSGAYGSRVNVDPKIKIACTAYVKIV